jgi:hypothetical protein
MTLSKGVGDSVGMAIYLENRYKGLRARKFPLQPMRESSLDLKHLQLTS